MRRFVAGAILSLLLCGVGWATSIDLRPNGDVQRWPNSPSGTGTGDCGSSTYYGCINSDVESPEDSTSINESTIQEPAQNESDMEDAPGDFGSTNSITLKVRAGVQTDTNEDDLQVWLEISGTQTGSTKIVRPWAGGDCEITTGFTNCSLTDSAWNSLSSSDINNLTVVLAAANNNVGMPDDTTFVVSEVEIVLDYNVAGADQPPLSRRMTY